MIIKVCGITILDQLNWLDANMVEMIGINLYPQSSRYVAEPFYEVPLVTTSKKVGIFVNEDMVIVQDKIKEFDLDLVQLHGNESVEYCDRLADSIQIIKVFRLDSEFSFKVSEPFIDSSSYFLFDTKTSKFGGSGSKFNWQILADYTYKLPFLLSGGIQLEDIQKILDLGHPRLAGIDINSGFEKKPGDKNLEKIEELLKLIKTYES